MPIWMYVNHPTKQVVIHENPNCPHVLNRTETHFFGNDHLRRDGGWISFSSLLEAKEYRLAKLERYQVKRHCFMATKRHVNHDTNSRHIQDLNLDVQPINSVTDHYQRIMGLPTRRASMNQLPKWLQWFGYFVFIVIAAFFVLGVLVRILF